jgi:hypothetical protein
MIATIASSLAKPETSDESCGNVDGGGRDNTVVDLAMGI